MGDKNILRRAAAMKSQTIERRNNKKEGIINSVAFFSNRLNRIKFLQEDINKMIFHNSSNGKRYKINKNTGGLFDRINRNNEH